VRLSSELPPFEPPPGADVAQPRGALHKRFHLPVIAGIAVFGLLAFYASLVVAFQVIDILAPGRQPDLGVQILPGLNTDTPEHADINERINVAILGLDLRTDEPENTPSRTDSVMIVTMDPYSKTGGAFSIPRDTSVEIPDGYGGSDCAKFDAPSNCGYTNDRINTVYERGEYTYKGYSGGGAGLIKDTIEHNFGIPVDYYVLLNFENFIDLIDELDGIDVDVPDYVYDPAYTDCSYCTNYYPVEFIEGPEHMNGQRALEYSRIRASDNDFKRIERQQLVVRATAKKAADLGNVFSNARGLYDRYKEAIKTDISDLQIPGLADLAKQIGPDNIRTVSMADATYPCNTCPGAILSFNEQKMIELRDRVFSDYAIQDDGATVAILNGTDVPDLAAYSASLLRSKGITSDRLSTDELKNGKLYDRTIIVNLGGKSETVDKLTEWLQLPSSRVRQASDADATDFIGRGADIVVVLGADVDLTGLEPANASLQESTQPAAELAAGR
jgi:LCP family protein required for cell wall assembly